MEYLLNPRNIRILESFCLVKTLFAFDYDGTLAPIVDNPQNAVMSAKVTGLITELNSMSSVAILTGRKTSDVKKLLPLDPFTIIGNHGSEGAQTSQELEDMKNCCQNWLQELSTMAGALRKLGVTVEDKKYTLSFHYRNSPSPVEAEKYLELILFTFKHGRVTKGKYVLNLIPEFAIDKGMALHRIMKEHNFKFGVYFGDDYTDEDVFRFKNPKLLTVKVGTEESLAKYFIKSQDEIEEVLSIIKTFIHSQKLSLT